MRYRLNHAWWGGSAVFIAASILTASTACSQNSILVRPHNAPPAAAKPQVPSAAPPRRQADEAFQDLTASAWTPDKSSAKQDAIALNDAAVSPAAADVSHRRVVSQVALQTSIDTPKQMHVGRDAALRVHLKNEAESPSKATRIFVGIPESVEFISAQPAPLSQTPDRIEFEVGSLAAGAAHQLELVVRPSSLAHLDFQVLTMPVLEQAVSVAVAGPSLTVQTLSPREALLRSQFIQGVLIENPSSTEVTNVAVTAYIPEGLNVAKLNRDAEIDLESRIVTWRIERLSPQAREAFQFIAVAESAGAQLTKLTVTSDGAAPQTVELATEVTESAAKATSDENPEGSR